MAMIDESMLDKKFWGSDAFLTAVYVCNIVWSQGIQCIPYQAVFGNFLELSNLRVHGCQVFFHIDISKQRKLGHTSNEGIFIGYASDCPAWLVYNPNSRSIIRIDNDVFNEQWKPIKSSQLKKAHTCEVELDLPKPNLVYSGSVSTRSVPDVNESSVASLESTPLNFSSDNRQFHQITDSADRRDYVLNLKKKWMMLIWIIKTIMM
jgi:hypothetical protein